MDLHEWAARWGVHELAMADLKRGLGLDPAGHSVTDATSEGGVQSRIRLAAAKQGILLWRNNVGAYADDRGNYVRYGLANDSKAMNENIKSSDLIGIKPNGQFICREVKRPGWKFKNTPRERAQARWLRLILSKGGDAAFITSENDL